MTPVKKRKRMRTEMEANRKIVFMGTPDFAAGILRAVLDAGYRVTGVVTQPDRPAGRKRELKAGPVKELAEARGIPVFQPRKVREDGAADRIRAFCPDLIVVAAFGQIIPKEILDMPKYGCVNVHASLLPAYRGASPIQHAILDGCEKTGVTIMKMNEGLDTGDIISQEETIIRPDETGGSLFARLAESGASLLVRTLPHIFDGTATCTPQGEATTPYAGMIKKEMGHIAWDEDAEMIERKIRAFSPWPSAYTMLDGRVLKIWSAHIEKPELQSEETGRIVRQDAHGFYISTGRGILCPDIVQIAGKKRMRAADFLRGHIIRNNVLG